MRTVKLHTLTLKQGGVCWVLEWQRGIFSHESRLSTDFVPSSELHNMAGRISSEKSWASWSLSMTSRLGRPHQR